MTWSLYAEALIPALENCVSDILQFLHYWRILKVSLTMDKGDDDSSIPKFSGSRWAWSRCRFYRLVPSVYHFTTKTNWLGNWRQTPVETLWNFVWYTKTPKIFQRIISGVLMFSHKYFKEIIGISHTIGMFVGQPTWSKDILNWPRLLDTTQKLKTTKPNWLWIRKPIFSITFKMTWRMELSWIQKYPCQKYYLHLIFTNIHAFVYIWVVARHG